jgi:chromosome segregation ATPase
VAEANLGELGEQIDAVLEPVLALAAGPVTALIDTLTGVRGQLNTEVTTARAGRAEALRQAAEDRGAAKAATKRAEVAESAAAAAETRAQAAELADALTRATERVDGLTARAEELAGRLARATGELDTTRDAHDEERHRATGHEQRANAAIAAAADRERDQHREFEHRLAERLEQLRGQHAADHPARSAPCANASAA